MNFKYSKYYLNEKEYGKILSEINANYFKYAGRKKAIHYSYGLDNKPYCYFFEIKGFNDINIYNRIELSEEE